MSEVPAQGGEKPKLPKLAVPRFSGGTGDDGDSLAEIFSGSSDLNSVFNVHPKTSITFGIEEEQNNQKRLVSNDEYRNELLSGGYKYMMAGDITNLGEQNLLVISIIDIEKLVQIAGDVRIFEKVREIEEKLSEMTRNIIDGAELDWTNKPKLAVVNPRLRDNADPAANVLGEILGIEITRTKKYAVYPRNATLETVQTEWANQRRSEADPKGPGKADRPDHVLSVIARGGGGSEMGARFNALIQNMDGGTVAFKTAEYQKIEDGIAVMRTLAKELTITDAERPAYEREKAKQRAAQEKQEAKRLEEERKRKEREARQAERTALWEKIKDHAIRSYLDLLFCGSYLWGRGMSGPSWDLFGSHWSFLPFTSIGLQVEIRLLEEEGKSYDDAEPIGGIIFNAGIVLPLTTNSDGMNVSLYGDGLLEINIGEELLPKGLLSERLTPGFDCGLSFMWGEIDDLRFGFDIKYRRLWYKDQYLNAIGIGATLGF
jgi:hypothetical protein